jgi:glycosyltransferase involved in cell wall biosynthesis/ubiquinone/menaquinone biosynthesis C-methylase UbiE
MKKILYIANTLIPTDKAHGYQIGKTCEKFASFGHDVELIVPDRKNHVADDSFEYYGLQRNFTLKKISCGDFIFLDRYLDSIAFYLQTVFFSWKLLFLETDKNTFVYSRDLLPLFVFKLKGNLFAYNAHNWSKKRKWFLKIFLGKNTKIVCNSEGTKKQIEKDGFLNTIAVPNGVDLEDFSGFFDKSETRKKLNLPNDKKIAMYVGHFFGWKGVDTAIESAKLLSDQKDILFVFVGGDENEKKTYIEKVTQENIKSVLFLGHVLKKEIPSYLRSADVLLLPNVATTKESIHFTSPIKMFEYMASGVPIVASDLPSIKETLNEKNACFAEQGNAKSLASGIKKILTNASFAKNISEQAKKDAEGCTWEGRAKTVLDFLFLHRRKDKEFYDNESEDYSKKRYPAKITSFIHFFFKKRLLILLDYIKEIRKVNDTLLEIGCADGIILSRIAEQKLISGKMMGIDISGKMIDTAKRNIHEKNISFYIRGEEPDLEADIIVEIGVLNFTDFDEDLAYVSKHVKPGGYYIASVSASSSLQNKVKPEGVSSYLHLCSYKNYEDKWKKDFEIIKVKPYGLFIPFLWRFPRLAKIKQPIAENIFCKITPNLFHEKIYLLKKK